MCGPLAHLVERSHGMGEVTGSIPVWSTFWVMFQNFVLKQILKSKGVPEAQIDQALVIFGKNPELFKKIADEAQAKVKNGMSQMDAIMEVAKSYENELKGLSQ